MKKIIFLVLLCTVPSLLAKIGCYQKGYYGETQFVECLCDCADTHPTCMWCGHYHEAPDRQIIITPSNQPSVKKITQSKINK